MEFRQQVAAIQKHLRAAERTGVGAYTVAWINAGQSHRRAYAGFAQAVFSASRIGASVLHRGHLVWESGQPIPPEVIQAMKETAE